MHKSPKSNFIYKIVNCQTQILSTVMQQKIQTYRKSWGLDYVFGVFKILEYYPSTHFFSLVWTTVVSTL